MDRTRWVSGGVSYEETRERERGNEKEIDVGGIPTQHESSLGVAREAYDDVRISFSCLIDTS